MPWVVFWILIAAARSPEAIVTINVPESRDRPAHTIIISDDGRLARSVEQRDAKLWVAVRTWDGGVESVDSEACPAIAEVAASLETLPPIPVAPPSRRILPEAPEPVPPRLVHSYGASLSFRTRLPDGTESDVVVKGGLPYERWGNEAVNTLTACWAQPL